MRALLRYRIFGYRIFAYPIIANRGKVRASAGRPTTARDPSCCPARCRGIAGVPHGQGSAEQSRPRRPQRAGALAHAADARARQPLLARGGARPGPSSARCWACGGHREAWAGAGAGVIDVAGGNQAHSYGPAGSGRAVRPRRWHTSGSPRAAAAALRRSASPHDAHGRAGREAPCRQVGSEAVVRAGIADGPA